MDLLSPEKTDTKVTDQLAFSRHIFDNYQALIRSVDTKAGALFVLAVFLGASTFPVCKDAVSHVGTKTQPVAMLSVVFTVSDCAFILAFLWLLGAVSRVIRPRGARFYDCVGPNQLIWQEHVKKHRDNSSYFTAVSNANESVLLRNLTDQIFELVHISSEKMAAINSGFRSLRWLAFSWLLSMVSGLILIGWK